MRKITQAFNKYELDVDSERTKAGLYKKAELGHFPGKAPIGYLNVRDENDRGYIIVNEAMKPHIKKSLKGMSVREEAIDIAVQEIIGAVEIPAPIIHKLKKKILNCLDDLYIVENRLIDTRANRLKELEHLIKKSYEDKILGKLPASMTDEIFKQQYESWVKERDMITLEIKESNDINRAIYKNIDLIIDFCNRLPELYINADLENKRTMLRLLIEEILYNHIDTELSVRLKPVFEALRMIKECHNANEKVLTHEKPRSSEV